MKLKTLAIHHIMIILSVFNFVLSLYKDLTILQSQSHSMSQNDTSFRVRTGMEG